MKELDKALDKIAEYKPEVEIQKPECEGKLHIGKITIPCAVLGGGIRVLSQEKTFLALGRTKRGSRSDTVDKLPVILEANNLKPFINNDLRRWTNSLKYQSSKGRFIANAIRAEVLPMICETFINAYAAGSLRKNQEHIYDRCRILQNGFAQLGIIALIDEATGYQDQRAKDTLSKILDQFLAEESHKWTRTFPLEFYRQIYRLRNWHWEALENGGKPTTPSSVAIYTDNYIYMRLAPGLLDELQSLNPDRRVRHHQWFNQERGHPKLLWHISGVIAIMKVSDDWDDFKIKVERVFPMQWEKGTLFYRKGK